MDIKNIYWAAGFLDGEGSFCWIKNPRYSPVWISAEQKERELLDRLKCLFGGSVNKRKTRNIHYWVVTGPSAVGIMMTLYSSLSAKRKLKIRDIIARWKMRHPNNRTITRTWNSNAT